MALDSFDSFGRAFNSFVACLHEYKTIESLVSKGLFRTVSESEIDFEQLTNTLSNVSPIPKGKSVLEKAF